MGAGIEVLGARLRRWWYLLTRGMWRGECAYNIYEAQESGGWRLTMLASVSADLGQMRTWWRA